MGNTGGQEGDGGGESRESGGESRESGGESRESGGESERAVGRAERAVGRAERAVCAVYIVCSVTEETLHMGRGLSSEGRGPGSVNVRYLKVKVPLQRL